MDEYAKTTGTANGATGVTTIRSVIKLWVLSAFAVYGWLRLKLISSPKLLILTYHRVLPDNVSEREWEQPGMVISPKNLQQHIKLIQSLGATPIHLDEWLENKRAGKALPKLAVAFTFDDGWRDNYLHGYPVLQKEHIPATIFLVTGMIDTNETFWPEQLMELLRTPGANLDDPTLAWLQPYLDNSLNRSTQPSLLEADEIINRLKDLDDATIIQKLKDSASLIDAPDSPTYKTPAILQKRDLSEMSENGLVKYGAHTRNHFRLNRLSTRQALEEEIVGCQSDLSAMKINAVPIFCYPNGDITDGGEQLVAKHYQAACTTKTGWNDGSRNNFDLHRFNLHNGNSSTPRALLATIGRSLV